MRNSVTVTVQDMIAELVQLQIRLWGLPITTHHLILPALDRAKGFPQSFDRRKSG